MAVKLEPVVIIQRKPPAWKPAQRYKLKCRVCGGSGVKAGSVSWHQVICCSGCNGHGFVIAWFDL